MFCDNLNAVLKARGIRQKELAVEVGVTKATMSGYSRGSASPSVDKIMQMAAVLDVPPAALLAGSDAERELICVAAGNDDLCRVLTSIARGELDRLTIKDDGTKDAGN